jgi:hypothetical protein
MLSGCLAISGAATAQTETLLEALVTDERMNEISGLAVSRAHAGILWVHNDGDNPAEIHAMATDGSHRATLQLRGVNNFDWEDIAAFEWQGRSYLLIADVGDNGGLRRDLMLHVVEEPAELADAAVEPAWTVRFRWPDGARDCEAVAVDAREGVVYLISKKRVPPELFRLALHPDSDALQVAERIGTLAGIDQPSHEDLRRNPVFGRYRSQITAADISPDGQWLAVLNDRTAYLWPREPGGWARSVQSPPRAIRFPWIPQAEALGFDRDGSSLWIGTEHLPAPLLRVPLPTRKAR